jgi:hypothetical protein
VGRGVRGGGGSGLPQGSTTAIAGLLGGAVGGGLVAAVLVALYNSKFAQQDELTIEDMQ